MALHPDFHQWLTSSGLQPATITVLRKESILQESTLQLLTDSDLQSLKSTHGITLGQFVVASGEQKGGRASKNNVAVKYRVGSGEREVR